ncbi:hypothetical protein TRFO_28171 [Tritrichomonas foetus]|uniref:Uncharacterized protein n=1 Tax=Tritrichomonas foetus TaxID=1144522 RepID=A0A1J4K0P8_9EUKA|nr:hypothetical protein TRFO_28171 [Tritrichomonas foetus]|eukprot:OHT04344.1 hypothetical protein TRFO_28171 [Tritrichomonas foetus]
MKSEDEFIASEHQQFSLIPKRFSQFISDILDQQSIVVDEFDEIEPAKIFVPVSMKPNNDANTNQYSVTETQEDESHVSFNRWVSNSINFLDSMNSLNSVNSLNLYKDEFNSSENMETKVSKPITVHQKSSLPKKFQRPPPLTKKLNDNQSRELNPDIISAIYLIFSGFTHSVAISSTKLNFTHVLQIAKELDLIDDNYLQTIEKKVDSSIYNFKHDGIWYHILDLNQYMDNQFLNIEKQSSINLTDLENLLSFFQNNYLKDFIYAVKLFQNHLNINIYDIKNNSKSQIKTIINELQSDLFKLIENINSTEISNIPKQLSQNVFSIIILIGLRELIKHIPICLNEYNDLYSFFKFMTPLNDEDITLFLNTLKKSLLFNSIFLHFPKNLNAELFEFLSLLSNCTYQFHKISISTKVQNGEKRIFISIIKPYFVETGSLNTEKIIAFGPNINLLHKFDFNPTKFFLVHDKEENLLSKLSQESHYHPQHKIFPILLSILVNPDNNYFNFCHVWDSGIIKRNNVMMFSTNSIQINDNQPNGIVVLRFYPILYNLLRKYCSENGALPFALLGSPGTGKSTMIAYIILRWYQMNDLFNEFNNPIETIIIKPNLLQKKMPPILLLFPSKKRISSFWNNEL